MEKNKKIYEQPDSTVIRVELESPICSGSSEIEANTPAAENVSQKVNSSFDGDLSGSNWDSTTETY